MPCVANRQVSGTEYRRHLLLPAGDVDGGAPRAGVAALIVSRYGDGAAAERADAARPGRGDVGHTADPQPCPDTLPPATSFTHRRVGPGVPGRAGHNSWYGPAGSTRSRDRRLAGLEVRGRSGGPAPRTSFECRRTAFAVVDRARDSASDAAATGPAGPGGSRRAARGAQPGADRRHRAGDRRRRRARRPQYAFRRPGARDRPCLPVRARRRQGRAAGPAHRARQRRAGSCPSSIPSTGRSS